MKRIFVPGLLLGSVFAASALAASVFPLTLKHDSGKPVTFKKTPTRVVTLSEEAAELLAVLNIKPVAFASGRIQGVAGQKVPTLSTLARGSLTDATFLGAYDRPSQELLVALKPDLILMDGGKYSLETYKNMVKFAPTLGYDYDQTSWRSALLDMGGLFGKSVQAERYLSTYDARLAKLRADLAPVARSAPNTTLLYMYEPQSVMVLGRGFAFSKNLTNLGLTLNTPAGIDPEISFKALNAETLLDLKTDRVLILRRIVDGKMIPRNATDDVLAKLGKPVLTYPLDPQEASSGPLTDLKRAEALAKLVRGQP